ncbi:putative inactive ATP-dependent zinc metalloprotease FTSHI 3 [Lasiodiplodia theobromae]|uniref:Putative inactive ATP-dependent zinc metalloprotease FTSHI 3 n=1 Tax=Lasiodiplodia theobromae TaxID=45133 RepID=A0A5N5CYR2_9PEZI|nr:putative inactive ATP-dependent zinc metalloprotease FTSHI 3 [Lasiodiplodia theobromae]
MTLYEGPQKCLCCINWVEEYPEDIKEAAEETSDAKSHAILCRVKKSHGKARKPLELDSIVIQSPLLKSTLGDVFADYPGITTTLKEVTFNEPFWEFFYRWDALNEAQEHQGTDAQEHTRLLLDTLSNQLGAVHRVAQDLLQNNVITPTVIAYGLKCKEWGRVDVSGISDIVWNKDAFSSLVLAEETKRLVASFVRTQMAHSRSPDFDDIIEGKGQGMVFLLTGEPGVGKTLTAETVAEEMRTPLYMVSAGELGISCNEVEKELTKILDLACRWNAILLLDESDVFLEQRDSQNLQRNQLVSVFLRMLEYYRGTMFLTTNRLSVFDVAFQSRIHLTLHYPELDHASRRNVWALLLQRVRNSSVSGEELDAVAQEPMNGRQIKNAVKAAQLVAADEGTALTLNHINVALRVMRNPENPRGIRLPRIILNVLAYFGLF